MIVHIQTSGHREDPEHILESYEMILIRRQDAKPVIDHQPRLNPKMKESGKKGNIKAP